MAVQGRAFLALWNDVDPAQEAEYEAWHAGEHTPERVSIPGMNVVRRYVALAAASHRYFTLYEAESLAVFGSRAYHAVVSRPTAWSSTMRVALRNFHRQPCMTELTTGRGVMGHAGTLRFRVPAGPGLADAVATRAAATGGLAAIHLGRVDEHVSFPLPNAVTSPDDGRHGYVVVVEAGSEAALAPALADLACWLQADHGASDVVSQAYNLISVLRHDEVDPMLWTLGRQDA